VLPDGTPVAGPDDLRQALLRRPDQFVQTFAEGLLTYATGRTFLKGAWSAYVEARPGFRDYIEELQLREQLDEIRRLGRMGEA
jgi:hypothetical protein